MLINPDADILKLPRPLYRSEVKFQGGNGDEMDILNMNNWL